MSSLRKKIVALKNINEEQYNLEVQYCNELIEIEKKYMNLLKPYWNKRTEIITGKYDNSIENNVLTDINTQEKGKQSMDYTFQNVKDVKCYGIPDFWVTTMLHHPKISENITEIDTKILTFLTDIHIEYTSKEKADFSLIFDFAPVIQKTDHFPPQENIFFTNPSLSLNFYYVMDRSRGKAEYIYSSVTGTQIQWKSIDYVQEAIKNQKPSFFMIFSPPQLSIHDSKTDQNIINDAINQIFEIGEAFKDNIIPHAIDWYTGKALIYDTYNELDIEDGEVEWININNYDSEEDISISH